MKFSLSTILFIYEKNLNTINFSELLKIPISCVELVFPTHKNRPFLKKLKEYNFKISSGHADYIGVDISSEGEIIRKKSILIIKDRIKFLKKIGAEMLVLHPGGYCNNLDEKKIKLNNAVKSLSEILIFAAKNKIKIALENMPNMYVGDNCQELLYLIDSAKKNLQRHYFDNSKVYNKNNFDYIGDYINSSINYINSSINNSIGICLDFGHAYLTKNLDEFFNNDKLFKQIINMHIHDNFGDKGEDLKDAPGDMHLVPGNGKIVWSKFINIIKEKYKGFLTFEIIPDEKQNNHLEMLLDLRSFIKNNF